MTDNQTKLAAKIVKTWPEDLRREKRWCAWFQGDRKPDGHFAKIPRGSHSEPDTWSTFADVQLQPGDGYGYNFRGGDLHPWDLDHVRNPITGAICAEAMLLLSRFKSFAEYSVSGCGIHVLTRGEVRGHQLSEQCLQYWNPAKCPRFFTVTGDVVGAAFSKIQDIGTDGNLVFATAAHTSAKMREELQAVDPEQWAKLPAEPKRTTAQPVERARTKTRKVVADFDIKDFLKFYDLGIDNECDNELGHCVRLTSCPIKGGPHVGQNSTTTNFIYPTSDGGLAFHCQSTGCVEYGASEAIKKLAEAKGVYPGGIYEKGKQSSFLLTETTNAERFVAEHGDGFLYCHDLKQWRAWDGFRWVRDQVAEVHRAAKETIRKMWEEAASITNEADRKYFAKHLTKSESRNARSAMVQLAQSEAEVSVTSMEFDTSPFLLNVLNGTLELKNGFSRAKFREHRREDRLTKMCPVVYDPEAHAPRFMQFLLELFADREDVERAELIHSLQRAAGYSLLGTGDEQCFFLLHGDGSNGKTRLLEALGGVMGDYAVSTSFDTFLSKAADRSAMDPRSGLARLAGSRFVWASESEEGKRFGEALIKAVTGGEKLTVAKVFQEEFEYQPGFKLWLATNHEPHIRGTDLGIWRRIRRFDFNAVVPEEKKDLQLGEKLKAEYTGILNWMLEGLMLYLNDKPVGGLQTPIEAVAAVAKYKAEQNILNRFLDSTCERCDGTDPRNVVVAGPFYQAYKRWAACSNEWCMSETMFGREMKKILTSVRFTSGPNKDRMGYKGIKVVRTEIFDT
jgi:putative DNA primase/helicase